MSDESLFNWLTKRLFNRRRRIALGAAAIGCLVSCTGTRAWQPVSDGMQPSTPSSIPAPGLPDGEHIGADGCTTVWRSLSAAQADELLRLYAARTDTVSLALTRCARHSSASWDITLRRTQPVTSAAANESVHVLLPAYNAVMGALGASAAQGWVYLDGLTVERKDIRVCLSMDTQIRGDWVLRDAHAALVRAFEADDAAFVPASTERDGKTLRRTAQFVLKGVRGMRNASVLAPLQWVPDGGPRGD